MKTAISGLVALALMAGWSPAAVPESERQALLALYNGTNGPDWEENTNWGAPPGTEGTWHGVTVDATDSHVIGLVLFHNKLAGPIPPELASLNELRVLSLQGNALTGPLPPFLGNLAKLRELYLNDNTLTGPIPSEWGSLVDLTVLELCGNGLQGTIPPTLGNLTKLEQLGLASCGLSGPIPPELGNLLQLGILIISENSLSGAIPDTLGNLTRMIQLRLNNNSLQGSLPPSLGNLSAMEVLDLYHNELTGPLPGSFANLAQLRELQLGNNQLNGPAPSWLGNLTQLEILSLANNDLEGNIPAELGSLTELWGLDLSSNRLSGPLPATLANLAHLKELNLNANQLGGQLPPELAALQEMEYLHLSFNRFSGNIPPEFGLFPRLKALDLDGNLLWGIIPPALGDLASLEELNLGDNLLDGFIPPELGQLANLRLLRLYGNQFGGGVPAELGALTRLQVLNLTGNQLQGPLPEALGDLAELLELHVCWNQLTGELPPALAQCPLLESLDAGYNQLEGTLPTWLGNFPALRIMILSGNRFAGTIPPEIGQLASLELLELSSNQLVGALPESLINLVALYEGWGLALGWNALFTENQELLAFVNRKHPGGDFSQTQTTAPSDQVVEEATFNTVRLGWTPSPYQDEPGGYEVYTSATPGGPYVLRETILNKEAQGFIDCLCPPGEYYFRVSGFTWPHGMNQNRVVSGPGPEFHLVTQPVPDGQVVVHHNPSQYGSIFRDSPSQILPATFLTFQVNPDAFPGASPSNPFVIWLTFPPGATLSQTLADGDEGTAVPFPIEAHYIFDLAVCEYELGNDGQPHPVPGGTALPGIGPHAVQLLRYFEGDGRIIIRITESTAAWIPSAPGRFIGFTIGLGGGVWPPEGTTNWGPEGMGEQPPTLFYLNLDDAFFQPAPTSFPVSLCAFQAHPISGANVGFVPNIVSLFTIDEILPGTGPLASVIGADTVDSVTVDLNGDGREDIVSIDGRGDRLNWAFGQSDGNFLLADWRELTGLDPVTVDAADVTGDGYPEILVGAADGTLNVFTREDLFGEKACATKSALPVVSLRLAGAPSDALVADLDLDQHKDYLYTDLTADTLTVLWGSGFDTSAAYSTGSDPGALTTGDFNGDTFPDVALTNQGDGSLSVFLNDGQGELSGVTVTGLGEGPVDVDGADFDRDGRSDLAVALDTGKALAILRAGPDGEFSAAGAQKIYFAHAPSAVQAENFDGQHGADALVGFSDYYKLALCTSDTTGVLAHTFNIDTRGDVIIDPVNNEVSLLADRIISVGAGTSLGGISSQQGLAFIQQSGFDILHFPQSQDLSFSVVNLDDEDALLNLELYNDQLGSPLSASTATIPAGTQFARYLTDLLGPEANHPRRWVRGFTTGTGMHGLWLVNQGSSLAYLDGMKSASIKDASGEFIFPAVLLEGGRATSLYLLNPRKEQVRVSLRAIGPDGQKQRDALGLVMGGRTRRVLDAATAFPGLTEQDSIRVSADQGILGVELFGDSNSIACLEAQTHAEDFGPLYCPHVAVGDFGVAYQSLLTLVDAGGEGAEATVTLRDNSGQPLATADVSIPAGGKVQTDVASLLGLSGAMTGYIRIDAGCEADLVGSITFGESTTGRFLSSLPLQSTGHDRFLLGHIASGAIGGVTFFTGLAILNPEEDPDLTIPVQISAYDQGGLLLDSRTLLLAGRQRSVFLLDQFMPGLSSLFGGYILVENMGNSDGVMVFELFGDTGLTFLSAVPAIPLD